MTSLVLGDLTPESLTPSVNAPYKKQNDENMYNIHGHKMCMGMPR
jgi:hypothetical protein